MVTWEFRVKRQGHLFPFFLYLLGQQKIDHLFSIPFRYQNLKWVDAELYYCEEENQQFMKIIEEMLIQPGRLKQIVEDNIKHALKLKQIVLKIRKINLEKLSPDEFHALFQTYLDVQTLFYGFWAISVPASRVVEKLIKEELAKRTAEVGKYFHLLTYPSRKLELTSEPFALFQLGAEIEQKQPGLLQKNQAEILQGLLPELKRKLNRHQKRFEWINSTYHINRPCLCPTFIRRLKEKSHFAQLLQEIKDRHQQTEREIKNALQQLKLERKAVNLVKAMRDFIFLRNFEKENANKYQYLAEPLILELARRLKTERETVLVMAPQEIIRALTGQPLPPDLILRQKKFGLIVADGQIRIITGEAADQHKEKIETTSKIHRLKGTVACQGKAQGRVKVVHSAAEISKVQEGDIMVTSMTTPDFVIAMERAAAIVTDEGGITCHAAIVSRELGVPCVIGTKIATKVLKDGDWVTVDAEKGLIIIK